MAKDIANGVLITSLILALSIYIPIVGFLGSLFIPLPTLFYRAKLGRKIGAVVPALTLVILVSLLGGFSIDILFFFTLLLIGFVLAELLELNLSIEMTVAYVCACVAVTAGGGLVVISSITSTGIYAIVSQFVAQNLKLTMALYKSMGMPEENLRLILSSLDKIQYVLIRIIPSLVLASTLLVTWTSLLLAKPLLRRKALYYPDYGVLNLWKAPEYLVWGVIGCGLMMLLPSGGVKMLAANGLLILMTIYFFQGIAIVAYYFEKKRFPRLLRCFLYSLIALQQMVLLAVIGLGFFDIWLNFRRLGKPAG
ncbi:MAG: DUF2232 domain-containing protein [Desulfobacterales bacterium]|nr:MAG: DUF2232 domain-containing protein [Desulfobacterales bacterium]